MKKFYESPSVEKSSLMAEENLLTEELIPNVSETGYGFDDLENGPEGWEG